MLIRLKKHLLVTIMLAIVSTISVAEDIDLFSGVTSSDPKNVPNVLIILDNTANWNNAFINEINALSTVLSDLLAGEIRVGLMMFSETGSGNGNPAGGYVRAAVRLMDSTNKLIYQNLINSLHKLNDKSNGGKLGLTMAEAYYYFSGASAYAGHNKIERDYAGNTSGTSASNAVYALEDNA